MIGASLSLGGFCYLYSLTEGGEAYERTANDSSSFVAVAGRGGRSSLLLAQVNFVPSFICEPCQKTNKSVRLLTWLDLTTYMKLQLIIMA